jgi:hypothetical protein
VRPWCGVLLKRCLWLSVSLHALVLGVMTSGCDRGDTRHAAQRAQMVQAAHHKLSPNLVFFCADRGFSTRSARLLPHKRLNFSRFYQCIGFPLLSMFFSSFFAFSRRQGDHSRDLFFCQAFWSFKIMTTALYSLTTASRTHLWEGNRQRMDRDELV